MFQRLYDGSFILPEKNNELAIVKERYWNARRNAAIILTLVTTTKCNLQCYYCYESSIKQTSKLNISDIPSILELLSHLREQSSASIVRVFWYGGEPLMNLKFLEKASEAIQQFCNHENIDYKCVIISNGTVWPDDIESFVRRHKVQHVQLTFDGLEKHHNTNKKYRLAKNPHLQSSFEKTVSLVNKLYQYTQVIIRYNLDNANKDDLLPFLDFMRAQGWFNGHYPVSFQIARVNNYTKNCSVPHAYPKSTCDVFGAALTHAPSTSCPPLSSLSFPWFP